MESEIPNDFICPITYALMVEPVVASDGHTYEKSAIEQWFRSGRRTSPKTNQTLPNLTLTPNYTLKSAIATYKESVRRRPIPKTQQESVQNQQENLVQTSHVVMIGNPGTGKSTFLNSMINRIKFKSGVSLGKGLTQVLQEEFDETGNSYIDTPGLSDVRMRQKAAQEIKKALTKGGKFKIFFVITLEAGRTRPDDLTTMKLVLEAAPEIKQNGYSIIINKVEPEVFELFDCQENEDNEENRIKKNNAREFLEDLNAGLPGTNQIYWNDQQPDLNCKKDVLMRMPFRLKRFLQDAPSIEIKKEKVNDINIQDFEKVKKEFAELLERTKQLEKAQKDEEEKWEQTRTDYERRLNEERQERQKLEKEQETIKEELEEQKRLRLQEKNCEREERGQQVVQINPWLLNYYYALLFRYRFC